MKHDKANFSVLAAVKKIRLEFPHLTSVAVTRSITRIISNQIEQDMDTVRAAGIVAHHIYRDEKSGEEVIISDRVDVLKTSLSHQSEIIDSYQLREKTETDQSISFQLSDNTNMNPVKLHEQLSKNNIECDIQRVIRLKVHDLRPKHVYSAEERVAMEIRRAWGTTQGDPDIVIAVIDDGFDLAHPCFSHTSISPYKYNFVDNNDDVSPRPKRITYDGVIPANYHGTPVASLIFANEENAEFGVAPKCTFLPLRVAFNNVETLEPAEFMEVFQYASQYADIVCCSFGYDPSSVKYAGIGRNMRDQINSISQRGGKEGKGLTMVFSAGNEGVPNRLSPAENVNGVRFMQNKAIKKIKPGNRVETGFPLLKGTISVGSVTVGGYRAAYSNIRNVDLATLSSDGHELHEVDPDYNQNFDPNPIVVAQNRPFIGGKISRGVTVDFNSSVDGQMYTDGFGGTSSSAPIVAGTIGLMKSLRGDLELEDIISILQSSAEPSLSETSRFNDNNLQNINGDYVSGTSPWYGAGVINVDEALKQTINYIKVRRSTMASTPNSLHLMYPGDAETNIDRVEPNHASKASKQKFMIDISWAHADYPEYQVAAVVAEFLRKDGDQPFPVQALSTDIHSLDVPSKKMTLSVVHMFDELGEYYLRVTFGGHKDVAPCVWLDDQAKPLAGIKVS